MTGSGVVYARRMSGRQVTLDFAEGLLENNLLMVDRETRSVWSQLAGKAVEGPMRETKLIQVPSIQTTWKYWRQRHPDTRVSIIPGQKGKPYYYRIADPGRPPRTSPQAHDTSEVGLGLVVGGEARFFPLKELSRTVTPLKLRIGGSEVTIHHTHEGMTAWAQDSSGKQLTTVLAYKAGWLSFYPDSTVFRRGR